MRFQRRQAKNLRGRTSGHSRVTPRLFGKLEALESREMLAGDTASAWHNTLIAGDVNFDQRVSSSDLLVIVNELLTNGSHALTADAATPLSAVSGSQRPRYVDVNNDSRVSVSDMMVIVNELLATDNMQVKTIVTDLAGNEITSISVGSQFKVQTYVTDIRTPPETTPGGQGVFSAGADIFYSSSLSSIDTNQTVEFGSFFNLEHDKTLNQGRVIGYAATSSFVGPGNAPQFLFSVVLTATAAGTQTFTPTLDTTNPDHEYNMYLIQPPFPTDTIEFVGDTLEIIDQPAFSIVGTSASETNADHPSVFTVSLSTPSASQTTVAYTTSDGSATVANNDYVATSGTLTFAAGQTTGFITVTVKGDTNIEPDETFSVVLSNPTGGPILGTSSAAATIINDDVQATMAIAGSSVNNVTSGTTTGFFTVTLSHALGSLATVQYATANNTALAGVDYQAASGTITFAPGVTTQTVPVTIIGDPNPDDVDKFFVNLTNPSANATISTSQAEIVINPAVVGVAVDITRAVSTTEGSAAAPGSLVFTISLSAASATNVVVAYATADGTATAGSDYVAKSATLTFTPGQTMQLITIQAIGDSVQEGSETFKVNMQTLSGGVGTVTAIGTIVDDDGPPTLSVSDAVVSASSSLTEALFTVTLSGAVTEAVSVGYSTEDSSAVAGTDYLVATGNLQFLPGGPTTQVVHVTILSSTSPQPDKTFFLNLSSATPPGVILGDDQGVGTIITQGLSISDASSVEGAAGTTRNMVFTVTLSRLSSEAVTVGYATANGTAVEPGDYVSTSGTVTFAPNTSVQLVTVTINGDDVAEGNENFKVILSNASGAPIFNSQGTGTIINDDGDKVAYQLELYDLDGNLIPQNTQLDVNDEFFLRVYVQDVQTDPQGVAQAFLDVRYQESLLDVVGTVQFGSYFSTFNNFDFEPGLLNDFGAFGPLQQPADPSARQLLYTVRFKATDVGLVNFVGSANESDLDPGDETLLYFSIDAAAVPSDQITITDRSINVGANVITAANATASESGQMVFTVTRFLPTDETATVVFNTANGTATAGQDYVAQSGTLTFAAGTTVQLVTVSLINDTLDEPDETFSLVLSQPVGASISAAAVTGTILDDDGVPSMSVAGGSASEGQGVVFNVSLAQASGKTVTVVYATTGVGTATAGLDYTPVSGTLTFAPGVTVQSVTVPTLGDIVLEANETFQLALSNPTNAVLSAATAQGTIIDVPPAGISGYVYVDLNGNGLKDINETGIQGAIITATNTLTGASQTVLTAADGSYTLVGLIPGTYTLTETQPGFFADGRDTRFGVDSPLNDQFVGIALAPSAAASGYNFGEQGIRSDFLSAFLNRRALFATATVGGTFGPNVNLPGTQLNLQTGDIWVSFDGGWSGLRQIEALFNSAQGSVTMKLYNNNLQEVAISAPSASGAILLYSGQVGTPYFLKISGSNTNVTVQISTPTAINLTATGNQDTSSTATAPATTSSTSTSSGGFNRFASATPMTAPAADPLVASDDSSEAFADEEDWLLDSLLV